MLCLEIITTVFFIASFFDYLYSHVQIIFEIYLAYANLRLSF